MTSPSAHSPADAPKVIALTGCAGFIGSATVATLLAAGHRVLGLDNLRTGKLANLDSLIPHPRFTFIEEDIADERRMAMLFAAQQVEVLVHLAALVSVKQAEEDPTLNFRLNVAYTHRMAEAVRLAGVRRLVFASSAAVYGNPHQLPVAETHPLAPIGRYGGAKAASEHLLHAAAKASGFESVCLRYFNVFGAHQDAASPYAGVLAIFLEKARRGQPLVLHGDGRQSRDFISVEDVAQATLLAAQTSDLGQTSLNICSGTPLSLLEIVAILREIRPDLPPVLHEAARPSDIRHSCGNPEKAAQDMGFRAAPARQSLRQFFETALSP